MDVTTNYNVGFNNHMEAYPEPAQVLYMNEHNIMPTFVGSVSGHKPMTVSTLKQLMTVMGISLDIPDETTTVQSAVSLISAAIKKFPTASRPTIRASSSHQANVGDVNDPFASHVIIITSDAGVMKITANLTMIEGVDAGQQPDVIASTQEMVLIVKRSGAQDFVKPAAVNHNFFTTAAVATSNPTVFDSIVSLTSCFTPEANLTPQIYIIVRGSTGNLSLLSHNVSGREAVEGTAFRAEMDELAAYVSAEIVSKQSGLVLLHGVPGTGKTTFIRHLVQTNPGLKFVVMPPEIFEHSSDPSFLKFMMTACKDAVLVIEDAERLLTKRAAGDSSLGISTLLNMGDGLLSDVLTAPIICTFNMDAQHIDKALLRNGRLIKRHEFIKISKEDVQLILDHEDVNYTGPISKDGATLADVYHAVSLLRSGNNEDATAVLTSTTPSFGFNR